MNDQTKSASKTFQKEEKLYDVIEWFTRQFETNDYQPEGTDWSGGEPSPFDPRCDLKHKYKVTITKL